MGIGRHREAPTRSETVGLACGPLLARPLAFIFVCPDLVAPRFPSARRRASQARLALFRFAAEGSHTERSGAEGRSPQRGHRRRAVRLAVRRANRSRSRCFRTVGSRYAIGALPAEVGIRKAGRPNVRGIRRSAALLAVAEQALGGDVGRELKPDIREHRERAWSMPVCDGRTGGSMPGNYDDGLKGQSGCRRD